MKATIERRSGDWDVVVNGVAVVSRESYQIASNVAHAINTGARGDTESDEVARAILDWAARA